MPEYKEADFDVPEAPCKIQPRESYNEFYLSNPELTLMPRKLRLDLPPLPEDIAAEKLHQPPVVEPVVVLQPPFEETKMEAKL